MRITIENYRGFDIEFDTDSEIFICIVSDERAKESKSFSAVKKFVDEYKKANENFRPFWIEVIPEKYSGSIIGKKLKVTGLRKDDRFIVENENGDKEYITDYSMTDWMIVYNENKSVLKEYEDNENEYEKSSNFFRSKRKEILSKLKIVTLKEHKKTIS